MADDAREDVTAGPPPCKPEAGAASAPREAGALAPGLYLVATPIGNLRDITLRALDTLKEADRVACEDTRITGKLLRNYGISVPMTAYHEHNAAKARPKLLEALAKGERVALVSDAGTPLISDPGYKLVRAALDAGHPVTAVPGPSASLTALQLSGLPSDRFTFAGFLPPKRGARRRALADIAGAPGTLILFESGPRLASSLADMVAVLGDRPAAVARELTKLHEEVRRGSLAALAAQYEAEAPPKGEIAVVIGEATPLAPDAGEIDALLRTALAENGISVRDAADRVAAATGAKRREIYRRALALKEEGG
jgi:16S rRNA (cytidine1402-2'-O)-methyltransferase